ncbi:unnamed protein product [Caretta caretta]
MISYFLKIRNLYLVALVSFKTPSVPCSTDLQDWFHIAQSRRRQRQPELGPVRYGAPRVAAAQGSPPAGPGCRRGAGGRFLRSKAVLALQQILIPDAQPVTSSRTGKSVWKMKFIPA